MKNGFLSRILAVSATVAALSSIGSVQAADSGFYKDKTLQILVGYSSGGGYDSYARALTRHLGQHIPGNPTVIARNVPGAGSLVLMNQIANTLPSDGTVIGTVGRGLAFSPLFDNPQAKYDPTKLNWLGSLNNETSLCVAWADSGVDEWRDLREQDLTVGATGAGDDPNLFPRVLGDLLDLKFNIVSGFPGGADVLLAMQRGEVQGRCGWSYSSAMAKHADWFKEGKVNILFQMSLKKHPDLPDVPLVMEMADTKRQRSVLKLLFARQVMGRPYVAPPDVPKDRLSILRKALRETAHDPKFVDDMTKQGRGVSFVDGEEIQDIVGEAYQYPDDVINVIKRARKPGSN